MTSSLITFSGQKPSESFKSVAALPTHRKRPAPFSLRLTEKERDILRDKAGTRSISAYIRYKLFGEDVSPRKTRRKPSADQAILSQLLGALGQSRLSSNLNQIAKAANQGALPVTPDLLAELKSACADIRMMRHNLIKGLGIKPEDK